MQFARLWPCCLSKLCTTRRLAYKCVCRKTINVPSQFMKNVHSSLWWHNAGNDRSLVTVWERPCSLLPDSVRTFSVPAPVIIEWLCPLIFIALTVKIVSSLQYKAMRPEYYGCIGLPRWYNDAINNTDAWTRRGSQAHKVGAGTLISHDNTGSLKPLNHCNTLDKLHKTIMGQCHSSAFISIIV